ncbi:two-component system, OmpR family, sensor histidine kinase PhoQ [Alteromonadaceae bacterium Bs31]|nr:two-component system, OmpR family, sensor histidine kinase PhoQ [Alteromonadaceae bacterium Bs31]
MQINSLAARLTVFSALVLPVILSFSAFSLDRAFRQSLLNAEQLSLRAQLYSLLAAAEPDEQSNSLYLPEIFAETRFNRPQSGLYAWVLDAEGSSVWRSASAPAESLPTEILPHIQSGSEYFSPVSIFGREHFIFQLDTLWEVDGKDHVFRFVLIHHQQEMKQELASYRDALWLWLGGITLLLVGAQFIITRFGLKPLNTLAKELQLFQQGHKNSIEGKYPTEVSPVIHSLNDVLASEQGQRQRYKNTLADLAHSLKTPLAIIRAELETGKNRNEKNIRTETIDEQIGRMADIVQHQLQRASLSSTSSIREKTPLRETLTRLCSALEKVYRDKNFQVELHVDNTLTFPGDESDAMELLGNLLENAFKYGGSKIAITAETSNNLLLINIGDDGPGIAEHLKQNILSRGARADTSVQGQGIGLSIVVDILSSYQGQLDISESCLGGAEFRLRIPI